MLAYEAVAEGSVTVHAFVAWDEIRTWGAAVLDFLEACNLVQFYCSLQPALKLVVIGLLHRERDDRSTHLRWPWTKAMTR